MASRSSRKFSSLIYNPPPFQCLHRSAVKPFFQPAQRRSVQTSAQEDTERYVPPRQIVNARPQHRAPFPIREPRPFPVNDDPARLNEMYMTLLGHEMGLPAEVKWQAITHKSFDHGRQPFNEKLAVFGKRILWLHASLHLLNSPPIASSSLEKESPVFVSSLGGTPYLTPEPFLHPDYKSITSVTHRNIKNILSRPKLYAIAERVRLPRVMRWKPKDNVDLKGSGRASVGIECLHAIIGAVALQRGGDIAGSLVRERFLPSMG